MDAAVQKQILETVDKLARERVLPRAAEIDRTDEFPRDLYKAAGELGLFGLWIPEEYGGIGPDMATPLLISERLARASASFALVYSNCGDACTPIVHAGAPHIKERYLPGIASGGIIPCFSLSEPGAGSDAGGITTTARREGDHYVIDGRKCWCTNGSVGDVFILFAKTDKEAGNKGVSAFVVPRDTPGFTIGRDEDLIGLRGSPATQLQFDGARVPVDHRLGEEGEGFKIAMVSLDEARLNCAAMAIGVATAALETAVAYAKERVQFGKPIIQHQGLQFLLAESAARLAAARSLWEQAMTLVATAPGRRSSSFAAMAKLVATDAAMQITTDAVQTLGGYGLSRDFPVERMMRDVKAFQIFDGTNQIQKMLIGRYLEKFGVPFADDTPA
ncbi:MAG TPA: acyl-CoA dehydrogenase family protein [Hypericibacter adhaerens]|uniref:acyl-CoA dehydrogenase family protein n=1 Tax=Hypericibacter adhaerens TaxID=2602016 RepID=UPI002BB97755|nr:acyl-CoA dehydrogenase family protein [Hypericibacter adhaerens]HWA46289.1 acyl-CoA dehydrogenase family protein [Hypericibacter adhaerens]